MHLKRWLVGGAVSAAIFGLLIVGVWSWIERRQVVVGLRWATAELVPIAQLDHAEWDALLGRYVDEQGQVDYAGWQQAPADVARLDAYLAQLSRVAPEASADRDAWMALWINAYNAVTVRGILREYPTDSIRNFTPSWSGYHIWHDLRLWMFGDQALSLNEIEHERLRPLGDPRIHFAIVCASRGCPALRNEAFTPQRLDEQLDEEARRFFADPTKFTYDLPRRELQVSQILKWFPEDFGDGPSAMLQTIAPWLADDEARELALSGEASIGYLPYDWGLNGRPRDTSTP